MLHPWHWKHNKKAHSLSKDNGIPASHDAGNCLHLDRSWVLQCNVFTRDIHVIITYACTCTCMLLCKTYMYTVIRGDGGIHVHVHVYTYKTRPRKHTSYPSRCSSATERGGSSSSVNSCRGGGQPSPLTSMPCCHHTSVTYKCTQERKTQIKGVNVHSTKELEHTRNNLCIEL